MDSLPVSITPSVVPSPNDGFRINVLRAEHARLPEVFFQCLSDGEVIYSISVWCGQDFSDTELGAQARAAEVWGAIARFLNAGGSLPELAETIRAVLDEDFPAQIYPSSYVLLDTLQKGNACHIFRDEETGQVIVISEDSWCHAFNSEREALDAVYASESDKDKP